MDRGIRLHALLALLLVGVAYYAWRSPKEDGKTITLLTMDVDELQSVIYTEGKDKVTINRADKGFEVSVEKTADAKIPYAQTTTQTFPGTAKVEDLYAGLMPLTTTRTLGKHIESESDKDLQAFGLAAPSAQLVLHVGLSETTIDIGNASYGSGDLYARMPNGEVFLLQSNKISPLKHGAASLTERNALAIDKAKLERVVLTSGTKTRTLAYHHEAEKGFFVDPQKPDVKLEKLGIFIDRVLRLRVLETTETAPEKPAPLRLEFFDLADKMGSLELWPPEDKTAPARTSFFKTPVQIGKSSVEPIFKDLENVWGE